MEGAVSPLLRYSQSGSCFSCAFTQPEKLHLSNNIPKHVQHRGCLKFSGSQKL
jgi:hypothetical protein